MRSCPDAVSAADADSAESAWPSAAGGAATSSSAAAAAAVRM
ncbi:MAG: hypothetical protein ABR998_04195 [Gemmatimonadales bacterium]